MRLLAFYFSFICINHRRESPVFKCYSLMRDIYYPDIDNYIMHTVIVVFNSLIYRYNTMEIEDCQ